MTFDNMIQQIAEELTVKEEQVLTTVELLDDDKTIPFISRYRKEQTGALNEIQIRSIAEKIDYLRRLQNRREEVLSTIEEQGKLTEELKTSSTKPLPFRLLKICICLIRNEKRHARTKPEKRDLNPCRNG